MSVTLFLLGILLLSHVQALETTNSTDLEDDGKIVGGDEVSPHKYPWVIGLWRKNGGRPFCGGSLITNAWVLTAAHCVYSKNIKKLRIVVGDHNTQTHDAGEQVKEICRKVVHHSYTSNVNDDIALLELCKPVKFSHTIQPIGLATKKVNLWKYGPPEVTVAGWGTTKEGGSLSRILKEVTVPVVRSKTCNKRYHFIKKGHICAGNYSKGGRDSCQGDSGGALWWEDYKTKEVYQVGIVSVGKGCARAQFPGVYTKISHYHEWIMDTMAKTCFN